MVTVLVKGMRKRKKRKTIRTCRRSYSYKTSNRAFACANYGEATLVLDVVNHDLMNVSEVYNFSFLGKDAYPANNSSRSSNIGVEGDIHAPNARV